MNKQENKTYYSITRGQTGSHLVDIEMRIENKAGRDLVLFYLPIWRPGRYELADYAKNIHNVQFFTGKGTELYFEKIDKGCWELQTGGISELVVKYSYYANQLDAGASFTDENQLYINPCNCFMYTQEHFYNEIELTVNVPNDFVIATGLTKLKKNVFSAKNFDELADSPFIASNHLQQQSYKVKETNFTVWFNGECKPDWDKIISDFKGFTTEQVKVFGGFPEEEYHFLYQILPVSFYHGVEHCNSTVIALGPSCNIMKGKAYENFLGISSHELFHAWNIKAIRPVEMYPYNFQKENYSRLGYVAEGVTTYYGDLILARAEVVTQEQYFALLNENFDKHFYNYGRFNQSVAEASFDTWLDGYSKGIPNRKVSIYTEGCLNALMYDLQIRKESDGKRDLDWVMKKLYVDFAQEDQPYTEDDFKKLVSDAAGEDLSWIFEEHVYGKADYFPALNESLKYVGCTLKKYEHPQLAASAFGLRLDGNVVVDVAPCSPAWEVGLHRNDEIIAVNGIAAEKAKVNDWIAYFENDVLLTVKKDNHIVEKILKKGEFKFYTSGRIERVKNPTAQQEEAFKEWLG